ncbi:MAG: hypothetical protein A4E53_00892 [Pelotomaculum sp. PtaB.Bin104]|nr:MAG: hypothetical protein A4E53_00892 [Pelotomaculum sp. PtaB.Bin104]
MALLKGSLAGLGLEPTGIAIACCSGSREKSSLIAQKLVAGGFGRAVKPAGRSVRYETRDGWFSWDTVAEGDDMINLFYSLGADDQPVDYLISKSTPGHSLGNSQAGKLLNSQSDLPVAAGASPEQAGKTGQQASSDVNSVKVRRRLF